MKMKKRQNGIYSCYATSIKTRIETTCGIPGVIITLCCYATSIKTRIETTCGIPGVIITLCCYATSIKTRIETFWEVRCQ